MPTLNFFDMQGSRWMYSFYIRNYFDYIILQWRFEKRKFWKWNTGIGFRNRERLFPVLPIVKKKKKFNADRLYFLFRITTPLHLVLFEIRTHNISGDMHWLDR
jgi:hypothetical protein